MSEMFRRYPQPKGYIPNNRPMCNKPMCLDIMAGETAYHTFEVPLDVDDIEGFEVIYKLGLKPVVIKDNYQVEYKANEWGSFITCVLYPHETKLFSNTLLSTTVQIKFYMKDNTVSYSEIYNVKVQDAIDLRRTMDDLFNVPPEPTDLVSDVGYGYTTDSTTLKENTETIIEKPCKPCLDNPVVEQPVVEQEKPQSTGKTNGGYGFTED